jgi:cobalt-zinc-cadmium efflux system membrane fusion protein
MSREAFVVLLFLSCSMAVGCKTGSATAPQATAHHGTDRTETKRTAGDEIALSPAQQTEGRIATQTVELSEEPQKLRVTGRIALADDRTARVGVRTDGLVMAVYAGLGDYVKKGQLLARYHADEVRDTRAQYRTAVAELSRAQAGAALAQRNYERAQTLLGLKAGSVQQVEQARQDVLSAETAVKAAQIEIDRTLDVLEDDLRVPADPTPGDETADQVPIFAPVDGYVIQKNVMRQENLSQLRIGQPATVTLPGDPARTFAGRITNLGQQFDPATRLMQVRIVLPNADNRLRPEMLASAEIPVGERKPVLLVPSGAVQQINAQDVVFVRTAADRFAVRPVQTGETAGGQTPITEGLHAGEEVVVQGSFVLKSHLLKSTMESE